MPAISIDGQSFEVRDATDGRQILSRAREIAEQAVVRKAANVERRLRKRDAVPVVALATPAITVPEEFKSELAGDIADIEQLYTNASMEMELRLLLAKQQAAEDDDEDVILMA